MALLPLFLLLLLSPFIGATLPYQNNCLVTYYDLESIASDCSGVGGLVLRNTNYTLIQVFQIQQFFGPVVIENNTALLSIVFPNLGSIPYEFSVQSNPLLNNISFPLATNIHIFNLTNNAALQLVDFPAVTLAAFEFRQLPRLQVVNMPLLQSLYPFHTNPDKLAWILEDVHALTSLQLPQLAYVEGDLIFRRCASLQSLSFPLWIQGGLYVEDAPQWTTLHAPLWAHTTVHSVIDDPPTAYFILGGVTLRRCASLVSFNAPSLAIVGSNLLSVFITDPILAGTSQWTFDTLPLLTNVSVPLLTTIQGTFTLLNLASLSSLFPFGSLTTVTDTVTIDTLPSLTSLNGLWVTSMGLVVQNVTSITSLHGLLLENIPVNQKLHVHTNANLSSLVGLERLTRIFGTMAIHYNTNLTDFTSLLAAMLFLAAPASILQCCPDYTFFQAPSLFTMDNFPCQVCTQLNVISPLSGSNTGGTVVNIATNGKAPASQIRVKWKDAKSRTQFTDCPWKPSILCYACQAPQWYNSTVAVDVSLSASFDGGRTYKDTDLIFSYIPLQTLLGDDWQNAVNDNYGNNGNGNGNGNGNNQGGGQMYAKGAASVFVPPYTIVQSANTTITLLEGMSPTSDASQLNYATRVQNGLLWGGAVLVTLWFLFAFTCRFCLSPERSQAFSQWMAKADFFHSKEKVKSSTTFDSGYPVIVRTSSKGGFLFITFLLLGPTLAMSNLAFNYLINAEILREMLPVDLSGGTSVATGDYQLNVIWSQLGSTGCGCPQWNIQTTGFLSPGTFTCDSAALNVADCALAWQCLGCTQTTSLATLTWNHTDVNAFATGVAYTFTMNSYMPQTAMQVAESAQIRPGALFAGWTVPTLVPLTLTHTSFQNIRGDPVQYGWEVQPAFLLPGNVQTIPQFSTASVHGVALMFQFQKSFATFQLTEINKSTTLTFIAIVASVLTSVSVVARGLLTIWTYKAKSSLNLWLVKVKEGGGVGDPSPSPPQELMTVAPMTAHWRHYSESLGFVPKNSTTRGDDPPSPSHLPTLPGSISIAPPIVVVHEETEGVDTGGANQA